MTKESDDSSSQQEGILLINKPAGKTSFHLVYKLRQLTHIQKIGHCGTLDPFATGVMVMLVGKTFTRLSSHITAHDKEYLATAVLGTASTTYDKDGELTKVSDIIPSLEEVEKALKSFEGTILQYPPMFSAKKIAGKKLYELARKGIEVERAPSEVTLTISLVEYNYPYVTFDVSCSKGTYIRSLAHDLGTMLKTGAYLEKLIRVRSGDFYLEDCVDYSLLSMPGFDYTHHLIKAPETIASR